jgi:hypothetical protein
MIRRLNPDLVHSALSNLTQPSEIVNKVQFTSRFNPKSIAKSGSKPSPKQPYHFASENNAQFLLWCVSDTGNCKTLVSNNIVLKWSIPPHQIQRPLEHSNRKEHSGPRSNHVGGNF